MRERRSLEPNPGWGGPCLSSPPDCVGLSPAKTPACPATNGLFASSCVSSSQRWAGDPPRLWSFIGIFHCQSTHCHPIHSSVHPAVPLSVCPSLHLPTPPPLSPQPSIHLSARPSTGLFPPPACPVLGAVGSETGLARPSLPEAHSRLGSCRPEGRGGVFSGSAEEKGQVWARWSGRRRAGDTWRQ